MQFCEACGAKLGSDVDEQSKPLEKEGQEVHRNDESQTDGENIQKDPKTKKKKKNQHRESEIKKKEISNIALVYVVLALVAVGMVLLFGSGTFSEPEAASSINNSNFDEIHKGVDLKKTQQINNLEQELKNNPDNLDTMLKLAHLLNDSGFHERAIEKYETYLKSDPNNADVMVDMGVCFFELHQYDKAIEVMQSAIKINPKHQIAHFNLGIVNLSADNREKAIEYWKKSIELEPNSRVARRAQELINNN